MARGQYRGEARGKSLGLREFGSKSFGVAVGGGLGMLGIAVFGATAARAQVGAPAGAAPGVPSFSAPSAGISSPGSPFAGTPGAFPLAPGAYGAPAPAAAVAAPPDNAAAGLDIPTVPPAWLLTPSVEVGETFTDNVDLAPRGSRVWDFITTVSPGLSLAGQTARLRLGLTYNPQELLFARSSPHQALQQRLLGTGTAEVWRDVLFFDLSSSISQAFIRPTGATGPTTLTTNENLQTVYTTNASPYLRQHLGAYADSETRYRFSTASTSGAGIAPETIHEFRETVLGGEFFGRLGWQLTGDYTKLDRGQDTTDQFSGVSSKDELIRADFSYPLWQGVSAIGGTGYERISDPTLSSQPKGVIWNAGLRYQPNEFVAGSLTYGERFGRSDIEFNATYNLDPQLRLSAVYTQTIQTSLSQIAGNTNQTGLDANGLPIPGVTPGSGGPFGGVPGSPGNPTLGNTSTFGVSSGSFMAKTAELDAVLTKERNTYSLRAFMTKESGNSTTTTSGAAVNPTANSTVTAERVTGATLGWDHKLRADLSATAGGSYYRTAFLDGTGRHDKTFLFTLGLNYALSRTASATISLSRSDLRSNISANNLITDIVMATVRKQF
jgi:uncharacterized protein (PEP-CTERM system associated)